jgi:signal transduction histidine kinase
VDIRDRLSKLHDVTIAMLGTLDLDSLYQRIVDTARALEGADAAALLLVDEKERALIITAKDGLSDDYAERQRIPLDRALGRYHFPQADDIRNLRNAPLGDRELIRGEGLAKVLGLAIWREGELLGALHVYSRDPNTEFDDLDRQLGHILAAQAGVAIANARLFDELKRVEAEREQFLSIVSHELRTPLTPLKALAQLQISRLRRSRERGQSLDLDLLAKNLESIERQVDRMNGLVTDLLSVSRAKRDALEIERRPMDLAGAVREVVDRYVVATREEGRHHFTLDTPESLVVPADPARIEQLLMNLIGNAVKYSPSGGEVAVSLRATDGFAEIAIRDQGIGIPKDEVGRLGDAFTRGAGRAATFSGIGVGFYVAKRVAEGHGGSVELESEGEDRGATARARLPL